MRFARILVPAPVKAYGLGLSQSRDCIIQWSRQKLPTKTPVRVPEMLSHVSPPFSKASYVTSSSFRCDGSNVSTSRPVMPKKEWSNIRASSPAGNAPRMAMVPGRSVLGWWKPRVEKLGSSNSRQPSTLFLRNSHSSGALRTPPGHRHPERDTHQHHLLSGLSKDGICLTHADNGYSLVLVLSRHDRCSACWERECRR